MNVTLKPISRLTKKSTALENSTKKWNKGLIKFTKYDKIIGDILLVIKETQIRKSADFYYLNWQRLRNNYDSQ